MTMQINETWKDGNDNGITMATDSETVEIAKIAGMFFVRVAPASGLGRCFKTLDAAKAGYKKAQVRACIDEAQAVIA